MNFLKYTKIYFLISAVMFVISIYALVNWGLKLGVDFTGGSVIEYSFKTDASTEEIFSNLEEAGVNPSSVQLSGSNYLIKTPPLVDDQRNKIRETLIKIYGSDNIEEVRFENVGPSVGSELIKKTIVASVIASVGILLWVAIQFKSIKFGTSAVIAMIHDTFLLVGSFSFFGHYWGAEVDFLFVTALLTTLSFSVHDTIVVFDRIRELRKLRNQKVHLVANEALNETMVRSLNNSFTIIFMLVALILLGGSTVKWFAAALLTGTIFGTYSSPFVAVPILSIWDRSTKK